MKKAYQSPETLLVVLSTQQVMTTTSNNYGSPEAGQDLSKVGETNETSGNLSRRRTVWDDEELEEGEDY